MANSSDERGEAPVSTPRESGHPQHAPLLLAALDALLRSAHDPFAIVLKSLREALAFDQAFVLEQIDANCFHCVAAAPQDLVCRLLLAANTMPHNSHT